MINSVIRCVLLSMVVVWFLSNTEISQASDYQYSITLDPPVSRYFVKPEFDTVGVEFSAYNPGDPLYLELQLVEQQDFAITVYAVDNGQYQAINRGDVSLVLPKSSKKYRVEISRLSQKLVPKDYLIDLYVTMKPVQTPKDIDKPLIAEPKIHKYVVLSVTEDGLAIIDPKIAIFRNLRGPISLLAKHQQILITVQNRGTHMFGVTGTLTIRGPQGFEEILTVPATYIFANSQKNLSLEGQDGTSSITLTGRELHSGPYTASLDLTILGSDTPKLYAQTVFWMISPIIVVASVLFCLMIIIVIFFIGIHHV